MKLALIGFLSVIAVNCFAYGYIDSNSTTRITTTDNSSNYDASQQQFADTYARNQSKYN